MHPLATKDLPDRARPRPAGSRGRTSAAAPTSTSTSATARWSATTDRRVLVGRPPSDAEGDADLTTDGVATTSPTGARPTTAWSRWCPTGAGGSGSPPRGPGRRHRPAHRRRCRCWTSGRRSRTRSPWTGPAACTSSPRTRSTGSGRPPAAARAVAWRAAYDRGSEQKPGQLSQGSGTTPTLLPGGLVAITDNAEPRMHVVVLRRRTARRCASGPVFGDDEGATENSLVVVGPAASWSRTTTGTAGRSARRWGAPPSPASRASTSRGGDCSVAVDLRRGRGRRRSPKLVAGHRPALRRTPSGTAGGAPPRGTSPRSTPAPVGPSSRCAPGSACGVRRGARPRRCWAGTARCTCRRCPGWCGCGTGPRVRGSGRR